MDILRCGSDAALVEVAGRHEVLGLRAALRSANPDGVLESVPAARTLLVRFDPHRLSFSQIRDTLSALPTGGADDEAVEEIVVPVRYDGTDLAEVAALAGLAPREVIARHSAARYTVAFCGFAPGFAYLTGLDPVLHVPRRSNPRTAVPAGSVAIADTYTAVYPRCSPGGWRLLGSTELAVWNLDRDPPTVLVPGSPVRFEEIES